MLSEITLKLKIEKKFQLKCNFYFSFRDLNFFNLPIPILSFFVLFYSLFCGSKEMSSGELSR